MIHFSLPENYTIQTVPHGSVLLPPLQDGGWRRLSLREDESEFLEITRQHVVLDVGNRLAPGVLDHHQFRANTSATQLVFENPQYVLDWVERKEAPVTLVVHTMPDIDCAAAVFLTVHLLENGALDPAWKTLVEHVTLHDQGTVVPYRPESPTPYFYYQFLWLHAESLHSGKENSFANCFQTFWNLVFQLFGSVAQHLQEHPGADHRLYDAVPDREPFFSIRGNIRADWQNYQYLMDEIHAVRMFPVYVQQQGTRRPCLVDGIRVTDPDSGREKPVRMFKVWARSDTVHAPRGRGFTFTWVTYSKGVRMPARGPAGPITPKNAPAPAPRHVLSVEPNSGMNLKGLGALLNRMELHKRQRLGLPGIPEGKKERFPGVGMEDPWYDGRGHDDTIVDSPREGTVLTEKEIESALQNFTVLDALYHTRLKSASCELTFSFLLKKDVPPQEFTRSLESLGFHCAPLPAEDGLWSASFAEMFSENPGDERPVRVFRRDFLLVMLHDSGVGLACCTLDFEFGQPEPLRRHPFETAPSRTEKLLAFNMRLASGKEWTPETLADLEKNLPGADSVHSRLYEFQNTLSKLRVSSLKLEFPAWKLVFSSLHESRHPGFAGKLFAAFTMHVDQLDHVQHADERELHRAQRIGDSGRMIAGRGGLYLFLNDPDAQLDEKELEDQQNLFLRILGVLRYHVLVHGLWKHMEKSLVQLLAQRSPDLRSLHALRKQALLMDAQLLPSAQSTHALADIMEKRFLEQLDTGALRSRLLDDLDDLDEYLSARQDLIFQRRIAYISLLILPLTLLADYLGALLFSWQPHGAFFPVALAVTILLLVLAYGLIAAKTRDR